MKRIILYRILSLVPIMLITSFGVFCLLRLGGSDPVMAYIIHSNLPATPELITEITHSFGLDKPLLEQYFTWLCNALRLDFGISYMNGRSVSADFLYFLPNTLILVACGFGLTFLCSVPLGIISVYYHNKLPDFLIRFFCFVGVSMPNFWLAFLLILVFSVYLNWLPAVGMEGVQSFILPSISIALMSICINARLIRANMLEVQKERHIIYAKMRGVNGWRLHIKHIFYNAFLPILTAMGMHIGELLGGALVIESVFALPGIGLYSIQGIANHDYPVIECFIVVLSFCFVLCNGVVDVFYGLLDPRIRKQMENTQNASKEGI
ncbi:ABC transporter permease subunit [Helicobacter sp. MIT 21-1697]|uniref:ABC transporter permease subunit n=1 Tax=Helicobacter sp. MIT 21-1697 TaxID=2993733 RepID=UPI00224AB4BF|nr:ABC transporter permease subunit [Helicobacter sp. MIT 21-1697]MCX2716434.1 ABC transporter permease subunit [Helicobacter sp. MIT 21-1697]